MSLTVVGSEPACTSQDSGILQRPDSLLVRHLTNALNGPFHGSNKSLRLQLRRIALHFSSALFHRTSLNPVFRLSSL
jgi:hypothetical protein